MSIATVIQITTLVSAIGGGGYWLAEKVPTKDDIKIVELKIEAVEAKTNATLDTQMEAQIKQINNLEQKQNKTPEDLNQLNYLRDQLKSQRQMRSVK